MDYSDYVDKGRKFENAHTMKVQLVTGWDLETKTLNAVRGRFFRVWATSGSDRQVSRLQIAGVA